jgi:hypothetical protein
MRLKDQPQQAADDARSKASGVLECLSRNDAIEDSGTDDFGQDLPDSQDGKSAVGIVTEQ